MASIFPQVTVTQIRQQPAGSKPTPLMSVGLIGPVYKRIVETKTNGYAIEVESAPGIAIGLNNIEDGEFIDYNSLEGQLIVNATGESVTLNPSETEVIGVNTLIKSGIELDTYGFYKTIGSNLIFYPQTGSKTSTGAVVGDWIYKKTDTGTIFNKIKQVAPIKDDVNLPAATSGSTGTSDTVFTYTFALAGISADDFNNKFLVLVDKVNPQNIYQYHIIDTTASSGGNFTMILTESDDDSLIDATTGDAIKTTNLSAYNWYVYDMPIGSLITYGSEPTQGAGESLTDSEQMYSIYSYNLRISAQGDIGRFANAYSGDTDYNIFLPDSPISATFNGARIGDFIEATNRTTPGTQYRFRITKVNSTVLKTLASVTHTNSSSVYTAPASLTADEYVAQKSFLVAVSKSDPKTFKKFRIVSVAGAAITVESFSTNFTSAEILSANVGDYNWFIYDMPPNALKVSGTSSDITAAGGANATGFDFRIVNSADYYFSGEKEVTILNHIADSFGVEIGLADIQFEYNVLVTKNANQLLDINDSSLRETYAGLVASYNPMGLCSALVELNSSDAYKILPTNIAATERDPDAPKTYAGNYYVGIGNSNYHDVSKLDWAGAREVLESVKDTQVPYYLIPLTEDESVMGSFKTICEDLSAPDSMKEMITFVSSELPVSETKFSNINYSSGNFTVVSGVLRWIPTTYYKDAEHQTESVVLLNLGAKKNDYVTYYTTSGTEINLTIKNIYPGYIDLGTATAPSSVDTTKRITIRRVYKNKAEVAEAIAKKAEGYNSFRVKLLWGSAADLEINGTEFIAFPMYCAAAAYAGMAKSKGVVTPKTNWTILGLKKIYNVTPYFSVDNLETMGSSYVDILTQDFDGGPVYSKRQFMTDGSELSGVEPVDELAKYIRQVFRPYLGKFNITNALFDQLGMTLAGILETYVPSKLKTIAIIKALTVSGPNSDRLSLTLRATTFKPFNGLDVVIEVV